MSAANPPLDDVSRETRARLEAFVALLAEWNPAVNLVSRASLDDVWGRHVADSAQLWRLHPAPEGSWLDLGSGAGFPGLVVAILARGAGSKLRVGLVESDQRKAAFLRLAATTAEVNVDVHTSRIEHLPPQNADVVSARAVAPLPQLLGWAARHLKSSGTALFLKGRTVHKEVMAARGEWQFDLVEHPSLTEPGGVILEIGAVHRG